MNQRVVLVVVSHWTDERFLFVPGPLVVGKALLHHLEESPAFQVTVSLTLDLAVRSPREFGYE